MLPARTSEQRHRMPWVKRLPSDRPIPDLVALYGRQLLRVQGGDKLMHKGQRLEPDYQRESRVEILWRARSSRPKDHCFFRRLPSRAMTIFAPGSTAPRNLMNKPTSAPRDCRRPRDNEGLEARTGTRAVLVSHPELTVRPVHKTSWPGTAFHSAWNSIAARETEGK